MPLQFKLESNILFAWGHLEGVIAFTDAFFNNSEPFALGWAKLDRILLKESQLIVGQRGRDLVFRLVSEDGRWHLVEQLCLALLEEFIQDGV